jgi:hypothetical protein
MTIILQYSIIGLTYLGLGLGYLPGLRMNRATIALVGATALLATGALDLKYWLRCDHQWQSPKHLNWLLFRHLILRFCQSPNTRGDRWPAARWQI